MAWTGITAAQTDANSPLDQTLMDLLRTNDKDHEDRIAAQQGPAARIFSHFAETAYSTVPNFKGQGLAGNTWALGGGGGSIGSPTLAEGAADDHSVILTYTSAPNPSYADWYAMALWHFTNRLKPLTFVTRFKFITADDNFDRFEIGYVNRNNVVYSATRSRNGIFLELGSVAGQWRFTSADANVPTVGTDFAQVADGTWFEVKIEFTDVGGNQAKCYIDGVLKETLTTNLPTARVLMAGLWVKSGTLANGDKLKFDRMLASAGGALSDQA